MRNLTWFLLSLRDSFRSLRRSVRFTALVVLTLALGIGGNTAILAVAHTIFFAPLPFPASDRLVRIRATNSGPGGEENAFNLRGPEIQVLEQAGDSSPFSSIVALAVQNRTATGGDTAERVPVCALYGGWKTVLGVMPPVGRWFSPEEERRGDQSGVVLISTGLWERRFGRDPAIIGKSIPLDNRLHTIAGVMPDGFHFPYDAELWTPATMSVNNSDDYAVFGRLKPGVSLNTASRGLVPVAQAIKRQFPNVYSGAGVGLRIWPIRESFIEDQKRSAVVITAVGGFFLLLATLNVASLLLVRSVTRSREMQIRAALGAGRARLVTRSLADTTVIAFLGGAVGVLIASQISPLISAFVPNVLAQQLNVRVQNDSIFPIGAALALSVLTAVFAGTLPALASASVNPNGAHRQSVRSGRSRRERFWMDTFVVLEFTLAVALIAGAGLMLQNFRSLTHRDLGIDAANLLSVRVSTTDARYANAEGRMRLVKEIVAATDTAPGVRKAAVITVNPLGGTTWTAPIVVEGQEPANPNQSYAVNHRLISPGLFETMGIRLLQGRMFTEADNASAPGVAIVSRAMAQRFWPKTDAIGKRVRVNRAGRPWLQVVGVVSDVEDFTDGAPSSGTWYLPYAQNAASPAAADVVLMVRTAGDPAAIEHAVEGAVHRVNKDLALYEAAPLDRYYSNSLSERRTASVLISSLAAFGLLLGALGVFGTLSLSVGERVREIGIRMVLGARGAEILVLIIGQGLRLVACASALGLGAAWALGRVLSNQLPGVHAANLTVLLWALIALVLAAGLAMYLPARRAARLEPLDALRME